MSITSVYSSLSVHTFGCFTIFLSSLVVSEVYILLEGVVLIHVCKDFITRCWGYLNI
jgi:hypothetical protein